MVSTNNPTEFYQRGHRDPATRYCQLCRRHSLLAGRDASDSFCKGIAMATQPRALSRETANAGIMASELLLVKQACKFHISSLGYPVHTGKGVSQRRIDRL